MSQYLVAPCTDMPESSYASVLTSGTMRRKRPTLAPRNRNFQRHMEDHNVYPNLYRPADGTLTEEPSNIAEIREYLFRQRPSDDPITEKDFRDFCYKLQQAPDEPSMMVAVTPIIEGDVMPHWNFAQDCLFSNMIPLTDETVTAPKPDRCYGAWSGAIHQVIREKLNRLISPSKAGNKPWVPNFFLEAKGPDGVASVVRNQAMYDGAIGARAAQAVRCFGAENNYDGNAYTIMVTLVLETMLFYTSHIDRNSSVEGRPDRFMTQVYGVELTGYFESFKTGITAYRNARDWAEMKRNELIEAANRRVAGALQNSSDV